MLALKCSLFIREYVLINALKALVSIVFYVWSPCNFPVEYYAEIFYITYKRYVLSIYCKKRFRRSNSMRKVIACVLSSLISMFQRLDHFAIELSPR
jgi:hypothetical protein